MATEKKPLDPNTIILAVLGLVGTITAALIGVYGRGGSTPTPVPPTAIVFTQTIAPTALPTDTVPAGDPTSTPAPATDTPVPTFTAVPPAVIGQDWDAGCISSLWKPYPADVPTVDKGNGCWQEPVYKFTADGGSLFLVSQRDARGPVEIYGLFAPLPESGKATFTVRLKKLDDVDFVMGIFAQPDVSQDGLLMAIPYGNNMKKLSILQKDNITAYNTEQGTATLDQGNGFSITFAFSEATVTGTVNPFVFVTNPFPLPSAQKWLFLGYRTREGAYGVDVEILDLKLE